MINNLYRNINLTFYLKHCLLYVFISFIGLIYCISYIFISGGAY